MMSEDFNLESCSDKLDDINAQLSLLRADVAALRARLIEGTPRDVINVFTPGKRN